MKLFSGRTAELETMNRILTDTARKRAARIEELERQVAQLTSQVAQLEYARSFEATATERAHIINEKNEELAMVREAATKHSLRAQELERILSEIRKSES